MKRWWIFVGSTVLVLSAVGGGLWWFHWHNAAADVVSSSGGSIGINNDAESSAKSADSASDTGSSLGVSTNASANAGTNNQADNGLHVSTANPTGQTSQSLGGSNSGSTATPAPSASVPGPADFGQYDQYKSEQTAYTGDLTVGGGDSAAAGKWLTVNYKGWLTNGKEFDESYNRGKPFVFQLGAHKVITGWEEGFNGMKVGGKRRIIVPPVVGYGATSQGSIPANSVLIFDVELLAVGDTQPNQ